jgi:Protein of unknown function (DUF2281)
VVNGYNKSAKEALMQVSEKIQKYAQKLPEHLQMEALDFIEYLMNKWKQESDDDADWTNLSLQMMMRGMEDEPTPEYTKNDLKISFK